MIEIKYRTVQTDFLNVQNKLKEAQTRIVDLEKSIQDIKHDKEYSLVELNKRIQILMKEKEMILLEKRAKIQVYLQIKIKNVNTETTNFIDFS